jgi:ribonuclease P protein component
MKGVFTLGKTERLKSWTLIDQLFKQGSSFSMPPFRVYYQLTTAGDTPLQMGVGVSSRYFKRANQRNRIKRLVRETYRLQKPELQTVLQAQQRSMQLFLIYTGRELPAYELVFEKMGTLLKRLQEITVKNTTA